MKNSPPGMSPSYELYRNLETYPVGCFIIYFYVSASRIIRILMRWKYHSALIAINPNIWYNTADIYSSAYQILAIPYNSLLRLTRLMCRSKSPLWISSVSTSWSKVGTVQE